MPSVGYRITVGSWTVDSSADPCTELVSVETLHRGGLQLDHCDVLVHTGSQANGLASGLASAAQLGGNAPPTSGGFSADLRGEVLETGDRMTIELQSEATSETVFTGELRDVRSHVAGVRLVGRTGSYRLAATRVDLVFQNQNMAQIVSDLAQQAGVDVAGSPTGETYPYFVVHSGASVARQVKELAARGSFDVRFDEQNRLVIYRFEKTRPDHTFRYGTHILHFAVTRRDPAITGVLVTGESPVSNQGPRSWHWLVQDISTVKAEAGDGGRLLHFPDGALRTRDSADRFAASKMGTIRARSVSGEVTVLGTPSVRVGDAVELDNAPSTEANGLFKVRSVKHKLNKHDGYTTTVGLLGLEGSPGVGAGGLQGAVRL